MESNRFSAHHQELDNTAKESYHEKFGRIGLREDRHILEGQGIQSIHRAKWPHVEYPDVYKFVVKSLNLHTGKSLKAYESLAPYNYYINGLVGNITVF